MRINPVIAIDGPPGSGKTTVSKSIARELGFKLIDTGAMYRAAALVAMRGGVKFTDNPLLLKCLNAIEIDFLVVEGGQRILIGGEDVEDQIRSEEIGMRASDISKIQKVRRILVQKQRVMGASGGVVCEGRDATTVIFPDAEFKFFLDASVHKRAERRYLELVSSGESPTFKEVYEEMIRRDIQDSTRDNSPLRFAPGVTYVDTTALSPEEATQIIMEEVKKWKEARPEELKKSL